MHILGHFSASKISLSAHLQNAQVLRSVPLQDCHIAGYLQPEFNYRSSVLQSFPAVGPLPYDPITALGIIYIAVSGLLLIHDPIYSHPMLPNNERTRGKDPANLPALQ